MKHYLWAVVSEKNHQTQIDLRETTDPTPTTFVGHKWVRIAEWGEGVETVDERFAALEKEIAKLRSYAHRHSYGDHYTLEEDEESERPKPPRPPPEPSCNQCGKARSKIKKLVGFAGMYNLCGECIAHAAKIMNEE